MKPIKVVCGIIWKDGQVFIARRKPEKSQGGFWEFPGGKLEDNEKPDVALIRELGEELGMEIILLGLFGTHTHHYEKFSIELIAYECEFVGATFSLTDHDDYVFVKPQDLVKYKMAPADLFIVERLMNGSSLPKT